VVSARLLQTTPLASPEAIEAAKPAPIVVPEPPAETPRTVAATPETRSATTIPLREEEQRRGPAFSREELFEALRTKESPAADMRGESDPHYPPVGVHRRESAIRRLWHRLIG
jgi:hypothetical protein